MVTLQSNAWSMGGALSVDLDETSMRRFAVGSIPQRGPMLGPDWGDWRDPATGWGVVLPADSALPDVLRPLVEHRRATAAWLTDVPILRIDANRPIGLVREDGAPVGLGTARGIGPNRMPCYLLVAASPAEIGWDVQARLAATPAAVGRLDPNAAGIENYVAAVLADFADADAHPTTCAVWSVTTPSHAGDTMGATMRRAVADPIIAALSGRHRGPAIAVIDVDDVHVPATSTSLQDALGHGPGLVLITSHGYVGFDDPDPGASLGLPVARDRQTLGSRAIIDAGPGGAVWFLHNCCSAGAAAPSSLAPIFPHGDPFRTSLDAIAKFGSLASPLASGLLTSSRPARGVVGQVELTFDWMIEDPDTHQPVSNGLVQAAVDVLTDRCTIGQMLLTHHAEAGGFSLARDAAYDRFGRGEDTYELMFRLQLAARNRTATVLLGDPAVAFPAHEPARA